VTGALAAVDVQDLPGDERGCLKEQNAADDVADLADMPERRKTVAESGVAFRRMRRRLDDARRDGVDPDAAAAFTNPDYVAIVIGDYRWRLGLAPSESQYASIERKLQRAPLSAAVQCSSIRARMLAS
jgi:hypothetical protein